MAKTLKKILFHRTGKHTALCAVEIRKRRRYTMVDFSYSYSSNLTPGQATVLMIVSLILSLLAIIATWKMFEKAGVEGWKSLIPIYNLYKQAEIVTGSGWMFLLLLIPLVNIVYMIWFCIQMAKAYGQPPLFAVGLIFLRTIFEMILGFGDAEYIGPKGEPAGTAM